jgi:hypothetical protein
MPLNTVSGGNKLRWNGSQKPFQEIYYLKLVDPHRQWSFWVRYTLLIPAKGDDAQASLWGIFHRRGQKPIALKKTISIAEIDVFHRDRFIQIKENFLSVDGCAGAIAQDGHEIIWNLEFEDPNRSICIYPYPFLYSLPFPKTKFLEPRVSTYVSGSFRVDGEFVKLNHALAHQAHHWGTQYSVRWAWGNCGEFLEDPTALFEGFSGQIKVASKTSPLLNLFYFIWEDEIYQANTLRHWFSNKSTYDLLSWNFEARCKDLKFVGRISRPLDLIAGVEYTGPLEEKRYCHNSNMADLTLDIYRKNKKDFVHVKTLTAPGACAFETVEGEADPRVDFVL